MAQRYEVREVDVYPHGGGETAQFEVGEDEHILDSEWRGSNRVVIAIATETTAERCMETTTKGTRCENDALDGSNYCGVHK